MMSMDSISSKDRFWLASNLHKMPGSEETQRILAESMKSWAMGYADQAERTALGGHFPHIERFFCLKGWLRTIGA